LTAIKAGPAATFTPGAIAAGRDCKFDFQY
jgi:hypothetical protein